MFALCLASASARAELTVALSASRNGASWGDTVDVSVSVSSTDQLASLELVLGSQRIPLPVGPSWSGTLSNAGLPWGDNVVTAIARDIRGQEGQASAHFLVDRRPRLRVLSPTGGDIAQPNLHLLVECEDDGPQGCTIQADLLVHYPDVESPPAEWPHGARSFQGHGRLDEVVCLEAHPGGVYELRLVASDPLQSGESYVMRGAVASGASVALVSGAPGRLLDLDRERLLVVGPKWERADGTLRPLTLAPRDGGPGEQLLPALGENPPLYCGHAQGCPSELDVGRLYPGGAVVLQGWTPLVFDQARQPERLDALEAPLSQGPLPPPQFQLAGDLLLTLPKDANAWNLRDLQGPGPALQVAPGSRDAFLGPDGSLVFARMGNVFRWRDGQETQLTDGGTDAHPRTDGTTVAFTRQAADGGGELVVWQDGVEHVTAVERSTDVRVAGGWVAFTRAGGGVPQVWLRSPQGTEEQVTSFGKGSSLEALQADGTVYLRRGAERYVAGPGRAPVALTAATGRLVERDGQMLLLLANAAFALQPNATAGITQCEPPVHPADGGVVQDGGTAPDAGIGGQPRATGGCSSAGAGLLAAALALLLPLGRRRNPEA